MTLRHPKLHPHTKFGIPTSKNIGNMHLTRSGMDGRTVRLLYASQSSFGGIKVTGYNINVLQYIACFVVNPITVDNFSLLFRSDFRLNDGSDLKTCLLMRWLGPDALAVSGPLRFNCWISFSPVFSFMYFGVLIIALSLF